MISEGNEIDPPKNGLIQYRPLRHFPPKREIPP